jgi:hypothetical protein
MPKPIPALAGSPTQKPKTIAKATSIFFIPASSAKINLVQLPLADSVRKKSASLV